MTLKILKAKGELEKTKNCTQHYNVLCMLISVYGRSACLLNLGPKGKHARDSSLESVRVKHHRQSAMGH